jgi:hypothetical protein
MLLSALGKSRSTGQWWPHDLSACPPYHREHTQQKIMMQCHELLTSLQCHEHLCWHLSFDGGPASSERLSYSLSYLYCNDDSLYFPGEAFPAINPPNSPRPSGHTLAAPSVRQHNKNPGEGGRSVVAMSSFIGGP